MHWISPSFWLPLGALGLITLLVSEWRTFRPGIIVGKLAASTAFVIFALWTGADGALETAVGQWMLTGFLLCWLGDLLLLPPGQTIWFRLGIGAFLLGHVAYATAFRSAGLDTLIFGVSLAGIALGSLRVLRWLRPHRPAEFAIPILCYVSVISVMVAAAIAATANGATPLIAAGAIAFATSDLSVARERFITPSIVNSIWGLVLYYTAQLLLVSAMAQHAEASS